MADTHITTRLICSLTAPTAAAMHKQLHTAVAAGADTIEIRLDFLDDAPTDAVLNDLLNETTVPTIVTCRPVREGGRYDGDEQARLAVLQRAADLGATWIDVEMDTPVDDRPEGPTILSYHNFDRCPEDLDAVASELDASTSAINKIAFAAAGAEDALAEADVIDACRKPTIAVAMGEAGAFSRILAKKFGGGGSFAALEGPNGSTIISGRNGVALEVLRKQLDKGKRKIAIFYGAGHMDDFRKRLEKDFNLVPTRTRWLMAWDLSSPKPIPPKEPDEKPAPVEEDAVEEEAVEEEAVEAK